ncbi:E3 ubiquitin-protein ligase [Aphelenchoides besseyi]|nr:E3 ubiquitin-protein ligase [Aphelenchoides besseyi]
MIHAIFTRSSISFEQHIDVYIIMNETSEVMDKFEGENYAQLLHDSLKLKQEQPDEPWVLGTQDQEEFITLADRIHYTITSMLMEKAGTNNIGLTLNTTYARRVIASGQNYDDFIERIRQYDSGTICSNVWWKDTIAYRCNTCAYNVCICDCGDEDVMSRAGFCAKHGKAESEQIMPPEELTVMSEVVITKILLRILNEFRGYGRLKSLERTRILASCVTEYVSDEIAKNCETFISFLQELAQVNPFSKIIAKIFVDPKIYKRISDYVTALSAGQQPLVSIAELIMLAGKDDSSTMNELKPLSVDEYLKEVDFLPFDQPEFECLLDEFMFYNIRLGIPQELNNFLLALLANEPITSSTNGSSWKTLNVDENPFFLKNAVWGMSTDLQNLLIHKELANEILTNEALAKRYILLLSSLQAVNVQVRKVSGDHIEHDQNVVAIQRCFTTEWDISSTFLLNCVASLTKEDNEKMRFFSRLLIERLKTFFTASGPRDRYLTSLSCFFHLPLLRQLSSLELQFFSTNGCCELISPDDQEFVLMHSFIYPLRIQATIAEYQAGMWIRSGNAIRASIIVYQQMGFSHGFLDFDFSIMRIAASKLDPDRITEMLFDAFHVQECLNYPFDVEELDSSVPLTVRRRSWVANLIDGYLKLLLELILVQTFAELKNEEVQKEIIQSIISEDEPVYSKIRAGKTEHRVTDEEFNQMLNNVATFVEPDRSNTNRQGHYELKKRCLETALLGQSSSSQL